MRPQQAVLLLLLLLGGCAAQAPTATCTIPGQRAALDDIQVAWRVTEREAWGRDDPCEEDGYILPVRVPPRGPACDGHAHAGMRAGPGCPHRCEQP